MKREIQTKATSLDAKSRILFSIPDMTATVGRSRSRRGRFPRGTLWRPPIPFFTLTPWANIIRFPGGTRTRRLRSAKQKYGKKFIRECEKFDHRENRKEGNCCSKATAERTRFSNDASLSFEVLQMFFKADHGKHGLFSVQTPSIRINHSQNCTGGGISSKVIDTR
jgi:hypothetical protein